MQRSETIGELFLLSSHPVSKITLELVKIAAVDVYSYSEPNHDHENTLTQATANMQIGLIRFLVSCSSLL